MTIYLSPLLLTIVTNLRFCFYYYDRHLVSVLIRVTAEILSSPTNIYSDTDSNCFEPIEAACNRCGPEASDVLIKLHVKILQSPLLYSLCTGNQTLPVQREYTSVSVEHVLFRLN